MGKYNADVRRYLREIRRGIPSIGKQKKRILAQIEGSINAFAAGKTDLDYAAIVARFGTPQQITASYLEEMDVPELTRQLRVRRKIVGILSATALAIVLLWAGVVFSALAKHNVNMDGHIEEQIVNEIDVPNENGGE